jgi:SAM-dependent methyltransferase
MATPSHFDNSTFELTRTHLSNFISRVSKQLSNISNGKLLEIGPSEHSTVSQNFSNFEIDTFDISSKFNPTIVGDITKKNTSIPDNTYDCVLCLEVLEHTLNPFDAIKELRRILNDGGYLLISAPLNWRIHGPIPDCWRFTEHGWKVLLKDFDIIEMDILETEDRPLFPIKYNFLCKCNKSKNVDSDDLTFRYID